MNRIILKKVLKDNNKCIVECDIKGSTEFLKFFRGQKLSCAQEYSINIEYVPKSILVLPTVCVFLPVCWIFDAELDLNEIDEAFYDSIPNIKSGYESMYPDVIFSGKIKVKQMEKNEYSGSKRALMFSGGVDAVNSLCVHYDEKPDLISIWGADIKAGNENGWVQKYKLLEKDAELFGCKLNTVKTNFREILYESRLNDYLKKKVKN